MSHSTLQQVVVLMLYGALSPDAVIADPHSALAELDLTAAELGWLADADPRAFKTDPYRRARLLRTLLEEYPATAALHPTGLAGLNDFFQNRRFRDAIVHRGSTALAFGAWILNRAPYSACALVEHAVARARRPDAPDLPPGHIAPAPDAVLVRLPEGGLSAYAAIRAGLGPDPVQALLDGHRAPPLPAPHGSELALITLTNNEAAAEHPADWLVTLLQHPSGPRDSWLTAARTLGADPGEDAELIDDLVAQGLLRAFS